MSYNDCILVAENLWGVHQPEIIADWLLRNGAEASQVDEATLRRLSADEFPEDGEERSWVIEDLYLSEITFDGSKWFLENHPDWGDAWLVPEGHEWEYDDFD